MNRSDLVRNISETADITLVKAEKLVDLIFDSMIEVLENNHRVEIRGFGTFVNRYYKSYEGRNPYSGKIVYVKDKRVPFFKAGKKLRDLINSKR